MHPVDTLIMNLNDAQSIEEKELCARKFIRSLNNAILSGRSFSIDTFKELYTNLDTALKNNHILDEASIRVLKDLKNQITEYILHSLNESLSISNPLMLYASLHDLTVYKDKITRDCQLLRNKEEPLTTADELSLIILKWKLSAIDKNAQRFKHEAEDCLCVDYDDEATIQSRRRKPS
jgi:hypothetical protein